MFKGERIGKGHTADIHPWSEGRVIKLFREGTASVSVDREWNVSQYAARRDLRVPKMFGKTEFQVKNIILEVNVN